jgi:hypothetical protein
MWTSKSKPDLIVTAVPLWRNFNLNSSTNCKHYQTGFFHLVTTKLSTSKTDSITSKDGELPPRKPGEKKPTLIGENYFLVSISALPLLWCSNGDPFGEKQTWFPTPLQIEGTFTTHATATAAISAMSEKTSGQNQIVQQFTVFPITLFLTSVLGTLKWFY